MYILYEYMDPVGFVVAKTLQYLSGTLTNPIRKLSPMSNLGSTNVAKFMRRSLLFDGFIEPT